LDGLADVAGGRQPDVTRTSSRRRPDGVFGDVQPTSVGRLRGRRQGRRQGRHPDVTECAPMSRKVRDLANFWEKFPLPGCRGGIPGYRDGLRTVPGGALSACCWRRPRTSSTSCQLTSSGTLPGGCQLTVPGSSGGVSPTVRQPCSNRRRRDVIRTLSG
jgi:hypothetical protein